MTTPSDAPSDAANVSVNKACELLGVSRRTMYNWMIDHKVEYVMTAGGSRRILLRSLYRSGNVPVPAELTK